MSTLKTRQYRFLPLVAKSNDGHRYFFNDKKWQFEPLGVTSLVTKFVPLTFNGVGSWLGRQSEAIPFWHHY